MTENTIIEQQIQRIRQTLHDIQPYEITILTGSNGSGKSLVRQQLKYAFQKRYNQTITTVDVSLAKRTSSNASLGALGSFMADDPTNPTSLETYHHIERLFHSFAVKENDHHVYIILDEPEIGMSKESQLSLAKYLKSQLVNIYRHTFGMLIITHSEFFVNELKDISTFYNMDGYKTYEDWCNRTIEPTDFSTLSQQSLELFRRLSKT